MQIVYHKLFDLLRERNISQKQIREDLKLAGAVLQRIRHNESITMETVGKLCEYLRVQPSDIVEIVYDTDISEFNRKRQIAESERQIAESKKQIAELEKQIERLKIK